MACDEAASASGDRGIGHGRIPVLDIGPYPSGEHGAAALARAIARGCEDTGCFECVPICVGRENSPRYEPTTYRDFTWLLILNFTHRYAAGSGEEA
jgi:hypothetical protein